MSRVASFTSKRPHLPFYKRVVVTNATPEQRNFAIDPEVLSKYGPFTLSQRVELAKIRFPEESALTIKDLRLLYSLHGIKLSSTSLALKHSDSKLAEIQKQKEQRLPQLLKHILSG